MPLGSVWLICFPKDQCSTWAVEQRTAEADGKQVRGTAGAHDRHGVLWR
jgi:hypothetical protein